jgi:hypothetical protein
VARVYSARSPWLNNPVESRAPQSFEPFGTGSEMAQSRHLTLTGDLMFSLFKPSNESIMDRVPKAALGDARDLEKYVCRYLIDLNDDQRKHALRFVIGSWLSSFMPEKNLRFHEMITAVLGKFLSMHLKVLVRKISH